MWPLDFDTDVFISDIEERPAIWDLGSDLHSNRNERNRAWEEICRKYFANFDEKNAAEKNKLASQLQRRWKSLRDCFKREHAKRTNTKNGPASSTHTPYVYYQQLLFLSSVADARPRTSLIDGQDVSQTKKAKKEYDGNQSESDFNISERLEHQNNYHIEDPDRNFALSLVPHLKEIPQEFKLDVQTDILMVLKQYMKYRQPQQHQHHGSTVTVKIENSP